MSKKKYIISISVCLVLILNIVANMFVPIKMYAITFEQEILNAWLSYGATQGIPYTPSWFQNYNGWNNSVNAYNTFVESANSLNYLKKVYITHVYDNSCGTCISLDIIFYDYIKSYSSVSYVNFNSYIYCNYSSSVNSQGLRTISFGYNLNPSGNSRFNYNFTSIASEFYINFSGSGSLSSDVTSSDSSSFFDRLWQGLKDMWYSDTASTVNFLFGDDNIVDYWDNIGNDWCDFVKTTLGITDNDTLGTVMTDIYNDDYSSDYWTNVDVSTINQITNTSNNLKQFWNNNVTVVEDGNDYHYEIKNYNSTTKTYPSYLYDTNYFNNYILYNNNTNTNDIVNLLQKIYNLENTINTNLENSIIITSGFADIDTNFNALSGIIAGAISVAWADIQLNLDSIFDDINIKLDDIFSDIHITIDEDNSDSNDTSCDENDFWLQVKNILFRKIPFYYQCVNFLEPVTGVNGTSLRNSNPELLLYTSTDDVTYIENNGISSFSLVGADDRQLDFDSTYDTDIFDGLITLTSSNVTGDVVSFTVPLDDFMGIGLDGFTFNLSAYNSRYKDIVSNIVLTSVYLVFAWSIVRKIPTLFGHSLAE